MADFNSSLPVRTEAAGDVQVKVVDSVTPSQQLAVNADGSVNITDNSGSLTVDAVDLDIRDLDFATDSVDVSGSNINISATDLDIRDLDAAQDNVAISDGTDTLAVNADGSINAVVTATDLDIRDLDSATDSVEAVQATHDNLNVNANIQVGDADVANGNPVPVSDAGGSLTVDATDLDIRDLAFATDSVDVSGSSVTVTATDLDIRDLTHASDSVKIGDGTDFLAVNTDGSINVVVSGDVQGTEVCAYNTSAAVAGGASVDFDYTVTAATLFIGEQVWASGSGKIKAVVAVETAPASGIYNTKFSSFNSTSSPNIEIPLKRLLKQVAGAKVRITITNRDNQAQDVYSTLSGVEV